MQKLNLLVIMIGCVLLTAAIFPVSVFAETVAKERWAARYNGPGDGTDSGKIIAVDGSGNVYVAGYSPGVGTNRDYATIMYDPNGVEQWTARHNGPGNNHDHATAIALDSPGNVYVTGQSYGSGSGEDFGTIKYDANGTELWFARYNGPGDGTDSANSIAVDSSGNVYVAGSSRGVGTSSDYVTIKYDTSGTEQWVSRYDGPGNSVDGILAMTLDSTGNIFVTGMNKGSGTFDDCATIKYDPNGIEQWVSRYDGPASSSDYSKAIAVDSVGNVYVAGGSYTGVHYNYVTIKYDASGTEQWVASYDGPANGSDTANFIAVDSSGNVYVAGDSAGVGTDMDYATIKYDTNGTELWVSRYDGPENSWEYLYGMTFDSSGNVYVTGGSDGGSTGDDCATVKYDTDGNEVWVARYNGPGDSGDWIEDIVVDSGGNVYVVGESDSGGNADYITMKYAQISCTSFPVMDFTKNCKVDLEDFALFALGWLECNLEPQSECL